MSIVVTVYGHDKKTQKASKAKAQVSFEENIRGTYPTMQFLKNKLVGKPINKGSAPDTLGDDFMSTVKPALYGRLPEGIETATTEVGDYISIKFVSAPVVAVQGQAPRRTSKPLPPTVWQILETGFLLPDEENLKAIEKAG